MTAAARKVLTDCRKAHDLLEAESDMARFRLLWVSGVALLRSVGHVLQEVDSGRDPRTRRAVDKAWERWSSDRETHTIFWEFIREERNNILKEYEFGFLSGPVDVLVTPDNESFVLDEDLFCPISRGHFAGEDCRDVLADAIAWWERELSTIDSHEGG